MTEEEVKTKWCPFARCRAFGSESVVNRPFGLNPDKDIVDHECRCIGSACMAWRWDVEKIRKGPEVNHGYCGLAGKP